MTNKLSGVIPALPTPLQNDETVDGAALGRLIDYVIAGGVSGVFLLGSMGEGVSLTEEEKYRAVETALSCIKDRVPLLVCVSEVSTKRTLLLGRKMRELGAEYLVLTTPFYYSFPHPESILEYVGRSCEQLGGKIVFYNAPLRTHNAVSADTAEKIMQLPQVVAWKDSSCDFHFVSELLHRYPDKSRRPVSFFQGDEAAYDATLMLGADGLISGGGTVFIDVLVNLYRAGSSGDVKEAMQLQTEFSQKMKGLLGEESVVDWVYRIKKALSAKGFGQPHVTSPFLRRDT